MRLSHAGPDRPRRSFHRGRTFPQAIAWFGLKSFWGHVWHLAASVIATEDIDSRDWMKPDSSDEFTRRVADQLGAALEHDCVTSSLDDDLWIDYLADTGDDADVSTAVAKMMFRAYELPEDEGEGETVLPRGQILLFGGDTAYPVATDLEIHNRLTVPFNRVLREVHDGKRRVLLGIPGNHDWYAGLDGFGRMFRERRGEVDRASRVAEDEIDPLGQIGHFIEWAEAFRIGDHVHKRPALPLEGYTTVQTSSYWALRLAPGLHMWGVDRQLRNVDFRQRAYFADLKHRHEDDGLLVVMPDPPYAYLEPYDIGQRILEALGTDHDEGIFTLSGDTHHYTRLEVSEGMHVTAGGGGAFLHPTRVARKGVLKPKAEFPGRRASRSLVLTAPLSLAIGKAGIMVHVVLALIYLPIFSWIGTASSAAITWSTAALITLGCVMIGGWRQRRMLSIFTLSAITGVAAAWLPHGSLHLVTQALGESSLHTTVGDGLVTAAWVLSSLVGGALVFGLYLMTLALWGLEHNQTAGALSHPGYKHFVRLRVRKDGRTVDGWVIGKVDPLDPDDDAVLVDHFTWQNPSQPQRGE